MLSDPTDLIVVSAHQLRPARADGVFATASLSPARILAVMYWARYAAYGKPLVLCDYEVGPMAGNAWAHVWESLNYWAEDRHSRTSGPLGLWVETEGLAAQAAGQGCDARPIPPWLATAEAENRLVQSVAGFQSADMIGMTRNAERRMDERPFLASMGVTAQVPPDSPITPTVRAYVLGVVLGLDEAAARDPHPRPPKRSSRN